MAASLMAPSLAPTSLATTSLASTLGPAALGPSADLAGAKTPHARARATAQDFEAVFLNSMFSQMFSGLGDGPLGGGSGSGIWRSFLVDEYAKSFARSGGIGIADDVYRSLLAQQEAALK